MVTKWSHFTMNCGVTLSRRPTRFQRPSSEIVAEVCDLGPSTAGVCDPEPSTVGLRCREGLTDFSARRAKL